ncbi:hypothetical protein SEA_HUBBS_92 [Microbacterium phage Hubbs]|nr:hypothetical protein SEA_HUBBS_92 [Microbacterium phage Hubbs]
MKVEYWDDQRQQWRESRMPWDSEWVAETNRLLGWEMYREAE